MKKILTLDQASIIRFWEDLDIVDAALCSVIDEQLHAVPVNYIVEQLPILRLKPDTIYRRLSGLVSAGILSVSHEMGTNFYSVMPRYKNLF